MQPTPKSKNCEHRQGAVFIVRSRRRRNHPVPPGLLDIIDLVHGEAQQRRLQPCCGTTAWRRVQAMARRRGYPGGPPRLPQRATARVGCRPSARASLQYGAEVAGSAHLSSATAIYANAASEEEQGIAARMWGDTCPIHGGRIGHGRVAATPIRSYLAGNPKVLTFACCPLPTARERKLRTSSGGGKRPICLRAGMR
jgi:hypothetical protein